MRLLGSGLEDNLYNLLSRVREECKGKYVLFPKKKLLGACGETVTEEELNVYIDSLAAAGYLDKKYADNDVVLLKPLGKSLTASRDEKPAPQEVSPAQDGGGIMSEFLRFIIAFLGGFSGALAGMAVFALLC